MRYVEYHIGPAHLHLFQRTAVVALHRLKHEILRGIHLRDKFARERAAVVVDNTELQALHLLIGRVWHNQQHYDRQNDKYFRQKGVAPDLQKLFPDEKSPTPTLPWGGSLVNIFNFNLLIDIIHLITSVMKHIKLPPFGRAGVGVKALP